MANFSVLKLQYEPRWQLPEHHYEADYFIFFIFYISIADMSAPINSVFYLIIL